MLTYSYVWFIVGIVASSQLAETKKGVLENETKDIYL